MKTVALLLFMACALPRMLPAAGNEFEMPADPKLHGEYPQNYQAIITNWLATVLADAPSAQVEWLTTPKAGTMPEKKGGAALFGYLVEFKLNSRNQFGTYTGMQKHTALLHDGKVIKATGFGF